MDYPKLIVFLLPPRPSRQEDLWRMALEDLCRGGIPALPIPPPFGEEAFSYWRQLINPLRPPDLIEWESVLGSGWWYKPGWERTHSAWWYRVRDTLRELSHGNRVPVVMLVAIIPEGIDDEIWEFLRILDPAVCVKVDLRAEGERTDEPTFGALILDYPGQRKALLGFFGLLETEPSFLAILRSLVVRRPSDAIPEPDRSVTVPAEAMLPDADMPSAPISDARPATPSESSLSTSSPIEREEVLLGVSAPRTVYPGAAFVARFAAYTHAYRDKILRILETEAPSAHHRLDLDSCRWRRNTRVTVRLVATAARVLNPVQTFYWNGRWNLLRFDVELANEEVSECTVLRFDIAVEGLPMISIRPEIEVRDKTDAVTARKRSLWVERTAPKSAFASYAQGDRREVLGRVRSLQIFTGIDVFLDCLSLRPGEKWKVKLQAEIRDREIFWLFWSRRARNSKWVDWEWRTALAAKTLNGIQPHPLESMELAPPPEELSDFQFGAMYEWYMSELRESWHSHLLRILYQRLVWILSKLW